MLEACEHDGTGDSLQDEKTLALIQVKAPVEIHAGARNLMKASGLSAGPTLHRHRYAWFLHALFWVAHVYYEHKAMDLCPY